MLAIQEHESVEKTHGEDRQLLPQSQLHCHLPKFLQQSNYTHTGGAHKISQSRRLSCQVSKEARAQ
jgi:hypothetical protein